MDSFEQLVAEILWQQGYWVRTSVKVDLTTEDKQAIELPTSPRWELDVVAYKAATNNLLVVECKSFLDSGGVRAHAFDGSNVKAAVRYKLFNKPVLRDVVFKRLKTQMVEAGSCSPEPSIQLCLACGRIPSETERSKLKNHFAQNGWTLWDEPWLRDRLRAMAEGDYENQISAVVAKLLLRGTAV
jgi:hypothetical protein